jgi:hypothetical protein
VPAGRPGVVACAVDPAAGRGAVVEAAEAAEVAEVAEAVGDRRGRLRWPATRSPIPMIVTA